MTVWQVFHPIADYYHWQRWLYDKYSIPLQIIIDRKKRIFTWGFGGYGRLGHSEPKDEWVPRLLKGPFDAPNRGGTLIAAGSLFTMAVNELGKSYCFGPVRNAIAHTFLYIKFKSTEFLIKSHIPSYILWWNYRYLKFATCIMYTLVSHRLSFTTLLLKGYLILYFIKCGKQYIILVEFLCVELLVFCDYSITEGINLICILSFLKRTADVSITCYVMMKSFVSNISITLNKENIYARIKFATEQNMMEHFTI